jgi:thioredoxin 1
MIEIDNQSDLDRELAENKKLLVLFYASWCIFCQRFVPYFDKKTVNFGSKVIHVLLDDYDSPMWDEYEVDAVPTVILFEDGKVSRRLNSGFGVGLYSKGFDVWLEKFNIL